MKWSRGSTLTCVEVLSSVLSGSFTRSSQCSAYKTLERGCAPAKCIIFGKVVHSNVLFPSILGSQDVQQSILSSWQQGRNETYEPLSFVCRLHRGGLHHPLPVRLQTERVVQLVAMQQVLRQRGQSSLQVAEGEAVQRRPTVSQAGPRQSGDTSRCPAVRDVSIKTLQPKY